MSDIKNKTKCGLLIDAEYVVVWLTTLTVESSDSWISNKKSFDNLKSAIKYWDITPNSTVFNVKKANYLEFSKMFNLLSELDPFGLST